MATSKLLAIIAVAIVVGAIAVAAYQLSKEDEGDGDEPEVVEYGDQVTVTYIGYLKDTRVYGTQRRVFDTCIQSVADDNAGYPKTLTFDNRTRGGIFSFEVGAGSVIPGWEKGIIGMRVDETSEWTIESRDAYEPYVDDLLVEVPREVEVPVLERMATSDFEDLYPGYALAAGTSLSHYFWDWPATLEFIDQGADEVVIRNEPILLHAYDSGFGWKVAAKEKDETLDQGAGRITVSNEAASGDLVDADEAAGFDPDTFGDITALQQATQRSTSPGIVVSCTAEAVTIDFNSEVYGKTLIFVVELKELNKPTA